MKFKDFAQKTCEKSSFHGVPYLANKRLHYFERFFWAFFIVLAAYFSIKICWNQWTRFVESPIVYAMQLTWDKNDFPYAGITLCSDYNKESHTIAIIEKVWGQKPDSPRFQYYRSFLLTLNILRYDTMDKMEPYLNDTTINNINFLDIMLAMRKSLLPPRAEPGNSNAATTETSSDATDEEIEGYPEFPDFNAISKPKDVDHIYAAAITEAGLCRTTSQISEYTNPYGELEHIPVGKTKLCNFMFECNEKITPNVGDETKLFFYLHNVDDIVSLNDSHTIARVALPETSLTMEVNIGWTNADAEVRNLPIAYRKCRYPDENNLKYFKIYRPGLCRIECRIRAALKMCRCKPYFYAVAPKAPTCDIKGMLCLVAKNWTQVSCEYCMPLCTEYKYTVTVTTAQRDKSAQYERTIIVQYVPPKMALKRRAVFSTVQLIVSFGGAIGLCLGASFYSVFEIIYFICEYCGVTIKEVFKTKNTQPTNRVHIVQTI